MSRPSKYRGKRIDNGEWIYGSLLDGDIIVSGPVDVDEDYIGLGEWCSVDPETVGQYTGVHEDDFESRELFRGDIIELTEGETFNCKVHYEICGFMLVSNHFDDGFIWFSDLIENDRHFFWIPGSKLIGNIYDNPELLA